MLRRHWLVGIFCASLGTSIGCQGTFESAGGSDVNASSNVASGPSGGQSSGSASGTASAGTGSATGSQSGGTSGTPSAATGGTTASQSGGTSGTASAATGGTTASRSGGTSGTASAATGGTTSSRSGGTSGTASAATGGTTSASTGGTTGSQSGGTSGTVSASTGGSTGSTGTCGNGQVDPGESCDGSDLQSATCASLGYSGGSLSCSSSCQFNVSACTGGTIKPTVVANRTSCAAPCGVFFDATSTSGLSGSNYWRANWTWDFNDPSSAHDGAIGFIASHVFDSPGTYNVVTRVHDLGGSAGSTTTTITVTAMRGTTYYVASSGSDSNNGTSMSSPFLTPAHAVSVGYATNNTILFRRGDTFAGDAIGSVNYATAGPFLMSAYTDPNHASTADPVITTAVNANTQFNVSANDLRFQHLHLVSTNGMNVWFWLPSTNSLVEYVEMEGLGAPGTKQENIYPDGSVNSFIFDNYMHDFTAYGIYASASNLAIVGNRIINFSGGSVAQSLHGVRLNACEDGSGQCKVNNVLTDNTITVGPTGNIYTAFTIHGDMKNTVVAGNTVDHPCGIGPTNATSTGGPDYALFEGNVVDWPAQDGTGLTLNASKVEARNNLVVNGDVAFYVGYGANYPLMPANYIDQVFVENNTAYVNPPSPRPNNFAVQFAVHEITTGAATFLNNIFWQGNTSAGSQMVSADGAGTETIDYNDMYSPNAKPSAPNVGAHGITTDPQFVSRPADSSISPTQPSNYVLQSTSPAINTGTNTHDYEDFYRVARPQGSSWDMGAFEYNP